MKAKSIIVRILLVVFSLRRPVDWVMKPLLIIVLINLAELSAEHLLLGIYHDLVVARVALTTLVSAPFVGLAFFGMSYLFRVQRQLAHLAMTDMLTGLPNRRAFMDQTKRAFVDGRAGYLLLIDADFFKRINDTYGHAVGDVCLAALAERIKHILAKEDVIGRIGGEEFAAFMPSTDKARLIQIGKHLTEALAIPISSTIGPIRLTVSIGATDTTPLEPVETAMQRADLALYQAKENGRARMVVGPRSHVGWVA